MWQCPLKHGALHLVGVEGCIASENTPPHHTWGCVGNLTYTGKAGPWVFPNYERRPDPTYRTTPTCGDRQKLCLGLKKRQSVWCCFEMQPSFKGCVFRRPGSIVLLILPGTHAYIKERWLKLPQKNKWSKKHAMLERELGAGLVTLSCTRRTRSRQKEITWTANRKSLK